MLKRIEGQAVVVIIRLEVRTVDLRLEPSFLQAKVVVESDAMIAIAGIFDGNRLSHTTCAVALAVADVAV